MQQIYLMFRQIFPFTWAQYDFMVNAFLAIVVITPLFGMLGTVVVQHKMAFFSDAVGHSALTGIGIGVLLGLSSINSAMILFAIVFALLLNVLKRKKALATDTVISVVSSLSTAIGLAILSHGGDFSQYANLMVGDVLSIQAGDIIYLVAIFIITYICWIMGFNALNGIGMNASLARSRGISVKFFETSFSVLLAVIVMAAIRWVGILIINALIILPAASARNISENIREYHFFSVLFSLFSGVAGLLLSYYVDVATGPMIVIIAALIFFGTFLYQQFFDNVR